MSLPRWELLYALVHERAPDNPDVEGAGLEVVFHDDDVTTTDHLNAVLTQVFARAEAAAIATTLEVQRRGESVVARLPAGEARRRVARARALVRTALMPLRITLRAPGPDPFAG